MTPKQRDEIMRIAADAKPGEYFGWLDDSPLARLSAYLDSITAPEKTVAYGCHCDLNDGMKPDGCVIDEDRVSDCVYAGILVKQGKGRNDCGYWKPIGDSNE